MLAPPAAAQRQTFEATFTTAAPGAPTGFTLAIDYVNPDDPSAKPPAVERVVLRPPEGSAIDTSVPARCTASEPELMLRGADACPEGSRVGGGELDLHTGAFVSHDRVTLLNNEGQLIFLTTPADAPVISVVTRARIQPDGSIVTTVPPVPGIPPPDPFTALDRVAVALDTVVDDAGRGYITTPPTCPASGGWTWRASFTYRGGVTETAESTSPCTAPAPSAPATAAETCLPRRICRSADAASGTSASVAAQPPAPAAWRAEDTSRPQRAAAASARAAAWSASSRSAAAARPAAPAGCGASCAGRACSAERSKP